MVTQGLHLFYTPPRKKSAQQDAKKMKQHMLAKDGERRRKDLLRVPLLFFWGMALADYLTCGVSSILKLSGFCELAANLCLGSTVVSQVAVATAPNRPSAWPKMSLSEDPLVSECSVTLSHPNVVSWSEDTAFALLLVFRKSSDDLDELVKHRLWKNSCSKKTRSFWSRFGLAAC